MGQYYNPTLPADGLQYLIDPYNTKSYSGTGNTILNLIDFSGIGTTIYAGIAISSTSSQKASFWSQSDGSNLNSGLTLSSGNSFSLSLWFRRLSNSYWNVLFGNEVWNNTTGYVCRLESASLVRFSTGGSFAGISTDYSGFNSSTFNHYAFIKNPSGNNSFIYINGVSVASGSLNDVAISKPLLINSRYSNDGNSVGQDSRINLFSHCAVYNRALSPLEVTKLYAATKGRFGL